MVFISQALALALVIVWLVIARALVRMGRFPRLADARASTTTPSKDDDGAVTREGESLSVVIACRDEAAAIENALTSLRAQRLTDLEIVVVDDRSRDGTSAILDRIAATDARVRVEHVSTLPSGWLGKTHALARGAAIAKGDWLLFTDADVLFAPDALALALEHARRRRLDHLVAMPHFVAPGFFERAFVAVFGLFFCVGLRLDQLRRAGSRAFVGVGAFNLVRTNTYRALGGHDVLRLEVADDVKLGMILRRGGARQACVDSGGLVRVRWQNGFFASMRGLIKNFFAGLEYKWIETVKAFVGLMALAVAPPALLLLAPTSFARVAAAVSMVVSVLLLGAIARRLAGGQGVEGLVFPVVAVCLAGVALASAIIITARGAVVWRDTRYSLRDLRAACVREGQWPRAAAPAVDDHDVVVS